MPLRRTVGTLHSAGRRASFGAGPIQKDLATGLAFPPAAALLLRESQLADRFSSPFWIDGHEALRLKLHFRASRRTSPVWIPETFVPHAPGHESGSSGPLSRHSPHSEHPRWPKDSTSVVALINASFIEETDLFLFLVVNPLSREQHAAIRPGGPLLLGAAGLPQLGFAPPAGRFSSDPQLPEPFGGPPSGGSAAAPHFVFWKGVWEVSHPGSSSHAWLEGATPSIDAQLLSGRPAPGQAAASQDYLAHLINPPAQAGAGRPYIAADQVWVDQSAARQFAMACYGDAFWAPFHWMHPPPRMSWWGDSNPDTDPCPEVLGRQLFNSDQFIMSHRLSDLIERVL